MQSEDFQNRAIQQVSTPYDDVFRTLVNDCDRLVIPIINEVFHENYTGDEEIIPSPNEHFLNQQGGDETKRITDSSFTIVGADGKERKNYLLECQSTADNSMLVRIFEYAAQIALDAGEIVGDTLRVTIPHCAVMYLRSNRNTLDRMKIEISTPGGSNIFDVPVMKVQEYTIDDIFEKNLLFLIPFHIFTHEKRFKEYNADETKLESLKAEYAQIMARLEELEKDGHLTTYYKRTLVEMSDRVLKSIAAKYGKVKEGVEAIMGGRVLEYEAKTILLRGMAEGMQRGRDEGKREGKAEGMKQSQEQVAVKLHAMGMSDEEIADIVGADVDEVSEWVSDD